MQYGAATVIDAERLFEASKVRGAELAEGTKGKVASGTRQAVAGAGEALKRAGERLAAAGRAAPDAGSSAEDTAMKKEE